MISVALANTDKKAAVEAAAQALGLKLAARLYSGPDLMDLKVPVLLVFDAVRVPQLTPDYLKYLRRTSHGGVRYSPALVFCDKSALGSWRGVGADPLLDTVTPEEIAEAMGETLESAKNWIASDVFVGPDRRARRAILPIHKRRREDAAAAAAKRGAAPPEPAVTVTSLDRLHRRIMISAQLLQGSTIENRRAFRALINELEVSAQAHRRADLAEFVRTLRTEAERLLLNANADMAALEDAVVKLGDAVR